MSLFRTTLLSVLIVIFSGEVSAQVYQYFDQEGTLIVTDNPFGIKKKKQSVPYVPPKNIAVNLRNDVSYDYYSVYGRNFEELVSSTQANGPWDAREGKRYSAQTRWNVGWAYRFDSSYRIDGVTVSVAVNVTDIDFRSDIVVLLPSFENYAALDHHDLKLWEKHLKGLLDHEHDHVNIVKAPVFWDDAFRGISGIRDLTFHYYDGMNIEAAIKNAVEYETARIGHDLIKRIATENDEYDRLTEHGMKPEMRKVFFGGY